MMTKKHIMIVTIMLIIFSLLTSSGCEHTVPLDRKDTNMYVEILKRTLNDGDYTFSDYIIELTKPETKWTVQVIDGLGVYYEKTGSYVRYSTDGHAFIIENGIRRNDPDFSFRPYQDMAIAMFEAARTIILSYEPDQFQGRTIKGVVSGPPSIYCDIRSNDMAELYLDPRYTDAGVFTVFADGNMMYFELTASVGPDNEKIAYILGDINYTLVLPIPDQ